MSLSSLPDFYFDEIIDCSSTGLPEVSWTTAIGTKINLKRESVQELKEITKETTGSATISKKKIIDDLPARMKIWASIFKDTPMPQPQVGSIGKSYGLLDSCFVGRKITVNDVRDLLKKAK